MDSHWSEEELDSETEQEKRREKQRKEVRQRQKEEKKILDLNYYPPEPMYIPSHGEQPPTMVNDLILAPENSRDTLQKEEKSKTEDRRIVLELLNEETDLDYYSDSESELDYGHQSYV